MSRRGASRLSRWRGRPTGFHVGIVGGGQAEVCQALLAAFQHTVESRQVLAVFNCVLGALQDLLYRVIGQRIKPQFLDLFQLLRIRISRVILVVVVQPEQGEHLVDCLDTGFRGHFASPARSGVTPPRRCR